MSDDRCPAFLNLDDMTPDRAAARLLPLDVARHCRALPIAQENGRITVAMADPCDRAARETVAAALLQGAAGQAADAPQIYLVQGDPALIAAWLADLALADDDHGADLPAARPLEVWLRQALPGGKDSIVGYAEQVASLLATSLRRFNPPAMGQSYPSFAACAQGRLLILPCLDHNLPSPLQTNGDGMGEAVLFACQPRWPVRRLLLIVRGDSVDDAMLAWAARLARASGAAATALMIAPHMLASHAPSAHDDISSLLSGNNTAGHKMQHAAQRLAAMQLDALLHLRQGAPEIVIREELASTPYDLAIAGVAVRSPDAQWRLRPLLHRLLPEMACPLLLTTRGE